MMSEAAAKCQFSNLEPPWARRAERRCCAAFGRCRASTRFHGERGWSSPPGWTPTPL